MDKRWGDPEAWKCLDDEQRDIISEWYQNRYKQDQKEHKREKDCMISAGSFALIPFAVGYAYKFISDGILKFAFELVASWLFYAVIFYVFSHFYKNFNYYQYNGEKIPWYRVAGQAVVAALVSLIAIGLAYK